MELGGFTTDYKTATVSKDTPVTPPSSTPGDSLDKYTETLKARVATAQSASPEPADVKALLPDPDVDNETRKLLSDNGFKSVVATLTVTDDDLKEIGVTVGQRRAVLGFIAAYAAAKRLQEERADAVATKIYSQQKPVSCFDDAVGTLGLTADQTTELATKYFTNVSNGDYTPFYARVEQLRIQNNRRGPFVVNPDLLDEANELTRILWEQYAGLPVDSPVRTVRQVSRTETARSNRESVLAFFDRWGFILPSRFVLGQMASYTSTVQINSDTDQDAAQSEAHVGASCAFAAVNASVTGGSGSGTQDSLRTSSLQSTVHARLEHDCSRVHGNNRSDHIDV